MITEAAEPVEATIDAAADRDAAAAPAEDSTTTEEG